MSSSCDLGGGLNVEVRASPPTCEVWNAWILKGCLLGRSFSSLSIWKEAEGSGGSGIRVSESGKAEDGGR